MVPGLVARWPSRALVLPASSQTVPSDQPTRTTSGFFGPRLRPDRFENGLPSPMGDLRAHQDPNLVEPLPFAVEGEQGADLEVSGRDVERLRDAGPLLQVPEPGPAGDTVVDDEELAALGVNGHDAPIRTSSRAAGCIASTSRPAGNLSVAGIANVFPGSAGRKARRAV